MPHAQQNTGPGTIELMRSSAPRLDGEGSAGMNATAKTAPPISTLREIEAFERVPLSERALPSSTYEMLRFGAAQNLLVFDAASIERPLDSCVELNRVDRAICAADLPAPEADGGVTGRAKFVRSEFVEKVKQSEHWQHQAIVPNLLAEGAEIW